MHNDIATVLKTKRKELGLSVKTVLERLNTYGIDISDKTLYGWESGYRQPKDCFNSVSESSRYTTYIIPLVLFCQHFYFTALWRVDHHPKISLLFCPGVHWPTTRPRVRKEVNSPTRISS